MNIQVIYGTSAVAKLIGIHPNTVRLYEKLGLITPPARNANGYRAFTDLHISQLRLARTAFQIEVLQNGLRKKAVAIVKLTARGELDGALALTRDYISAVEQEMNNAREAVVIADAILSNSLPADDFALTRKAASEELGVTMDTLRGWEMNGLLRVKRRENGYRVYNAEDLQRLKIIRTLRCANYSLSAILRMLGGLDGGALPDIGAALNAPGEDETIISACDKLLISLDNARGNALLIEKMLFEMKKEFNYPLL